MQQAIIVMLSVYVCVWLTLRPKSTNKPPVDSFVPKITNKRRERSFDHNLKLAFNLTF